MLSFPIHLVILENILSIFTLTRSKINQHLCTPRDQYKELEHLKSNQLLPTCIIALYLNYFNLHRALLMLFYKVNVCLVY